MAAGAFAVLVGVVAAEGLQSAGVKRAAATAPQANDDGADAERHQAMSQFVTDLTEVARWLNAR